MYKITKKRTQGLLSRMFNYDTGSDTKIVKKSDFATSNNKVSPVLKGREVEFNPNIVADTKKRVMAKTNLTDTPAQFTKAA